MRSTTCSVATGCGAGKATTVAEFAKLMVRRQQRWEEISGPWFDDPYLGGVCQPADVMEQISDHSSMIILGGVGTGKSYLARALMREAHFLGKSSKFVKATQLAHEEVDDLRANETLIIDDLGTEEPSARMTSKLFEVFDERGGNVILTSNLDAEQFIARVGDRIVDRIDGPTIMLSGPSRRKHKVEEPKSMFDAYGDNTTAVVEERLGEGEERWLQFFAAMFTAGLWEVYSDFHDDSEEHGISDGMAIADVYAGNQAKFLDVVQSMYPGIELPTACEENDMAGSS